MANMTKIFRHWLLFVLFCVLPGPVQAGGAADTDAGSVFVLPVSGPIDKSMLYVFRRAFREVEKLQPKAVILELDTPGGALSETREIIAWMRSVKKQNCPVYVYVNPDALSAGAMISLGSSGIYMSPAATIGSAMPIALSPFGGGVQELSADVKEKMLSAVRAMVVSLAQENNYRPEVAVAMVDPEHDDLLAGGEIVCPKGKLLNLTALDATRIHPGEQQPLLARAIVDDLSLLLADIGHSEANLIRFQEQHADHLARWITALGPLLLGLGVLALWIEFKTPGFGIFGISGIILLCIYFFGHYVAGLAGLEEVALVFVGIILLTIEIFLIPGFGFTGITGIICILLGVSLAVIPRFHDLPPLFKNEPQLLEFYFKAALRELGGTLVIMAVGAWALSKILPKTSAYQALVLKKELTSEDGYVSSDLENKKKLLGKTGLAFTMLRPAGTVLIDGQRIDVITSGDLIAKGKMVKIIAVEGTAITVEEIEELPPSE